MWAGCDGTRTEAGGVSKDRLLGLGEFERELNRLRPWTFEGLVLLRATEKEHSITSSRRFPGWQGRRVWIII